MQFWLKKIKEVMSLLSTIGYEIYLPLSGKKQEIEQKKLRMEAGLVLKDRYKIINKLGAGGFGSTYLAEDTCLPGNPFCVVKHLKPINANTRILDVARRVFKTEAQCLHTLGQKHDQIPTLFAYFCEYDEFFLVLGFVEGNTLQFSGKKCQEIEVVNLLVDILQVLTFIHQNDLIHRDIKPDNIIRSSSDNKLFLIDFGAVKQIIDSQGHLQANNLTIAIGTDGYMAPEQKVGHPTLRSDVFAVGMIGIQALTGIKPHLLAVDNENSIIWHSKALQASSHLKAILDSMVQYQCRDRPHASEALQALVELRDSIG